MKQVIKRQIHLALHSLGYDINKISSLQTDVFDVQRQIIKGDQPVIFDVGAHVGLVTEKYRTLFPKANIHSFEPFPSSFDSLKDRVAEQSNTTVNNFALSDVVGEATLNSNLSASTNSLLPSHKKAALYWGDGLLETSSTIEVETSTIDAYCESNNIIEIDILKIDVQGGEYSVLEGAVETLSKQKIKLLYFELIMCPTYLGQTNFSDYLVLLQSHGYRFVDFFNPVRKNNQLIQTDVLFLSESFE